ncbi:energy-coupling factor transporter transmembrane component T [Mitsuokella sp.]|uniref:energy-coupling factor transporter transmembrane component T n=1 Tax=Mitsuokella sp. TaxID=2049034 RepID=UPI003D7CD3D0
MGMLKVLRAQAGRRHHGHAGLCLALLVLFLLAVVTARTSAFLWTALGGELLLLAFLPAKLLRQDIMGALAAAVFCLLLILPALLFWGSGPVLLLPFKTFLCVTALNLLQQHFSWHELTAALRRFHLPPEVIFILDTTLRYLVLLGDQASLLLTALKLRSVGHNRKKHKAMAGIMGIVMQRSQRLSIEMAEAMRCRCFTGEYPLLQAKKSSSSIGSLLPPVILLLVYGFLYLRLEGFL